LTVHYTENGINEYRNTSFQ